LFERGAIVGVHSSVVKTFRHHSLPLRALIVAGLMVAWLVASNHCAIGLMKPQPGTAAVHAVCHNCQSEPMKPQPASGGDRECCKALQGMPADTAKVDVKYDAALFTLIDFVAAAVPLPTEPQAARALDTGPQRSISFAELILQRSLLSHAPPFAV
jgi:hypothetical protein